MAMMTLTVPTVHKYAVKSRDSETRIEGGYWELPISTVVYVVIGFYP